MANNAPTDEAITATVREYFESFLLTFSSEAEGGRVDAQPPHSTFAEGGVTETAFKDHARRDYVEQCDALRDSEKSTLFVDFQHLQAHDPELADAVRDNFHHLEVHLRLSICKVMAMLHEVYAMDKTFQVRAG